jgi:hypothetical protein
MEGNMTDSIAAQAGEIEVAAQPKPRPFAWLAGIWFQPRKTLADICSQEKAVWLTPLLLLSALQVIKSLIEGPIKSAAAAAEAANSMLNSPEMSYLTPDEISKIQQGAAVTNGPVFTVVFPALIAILGIWVSWIILGSILHLGLTLAGNRNNAGTSLNLAAWTSLPIALRLVIQIIATLATQSAITQPGLAGFMNPTGGFSTYLTMVLSLVDVYLVWQIVLLIVGARLMGNITRSKAIGTVLVCVFLVLLLQAIPGTVTQVISGMSFSRPFFF